MQTVKLDTSRLYGFKILKQPTLAAQGHKTGPKIGAKVGSKIGSKVGVKVGSPAA